MRDSSDTPPTREIPDDTEARLACAGLGPQGGYLDLGHVGGRPIRLKHAQSVRIAAAPGSGKSTRFVIPSILRAAQTSLVVHDPHGELWDTCAQWVQRNGHAVRIDWTGGGPAGRFNVLDHRVVPEPHHARAPYLEALGKIIAASDSPHPEANRTERGTAHTIAGFAAYALCAAEAKRSRRGEDAPYGGRAEEATLEAVARIARAALERSAFEAMMTHADEQRFNLPPSTWLEPLRSLPESTRHPLAARATIRLAPFEKPTVAERTAACDFLPEALAGTATRDPRRGPHYRPTYVFIGGAPRRESAAGRLSALLIDVLAETALRATAGERTRSGELTGPLGTSFLLDDAHLLAPMPRLALSMELGQARRCAHLIVSHSRHSLGNQPGPIDTLFGADVVLPGQHPADAATLIRHGAEAAKHYRSALAPGGLGSHGHLIVLRGAQRQPIRGEARAYWEVPELVARATPLPTTR